MENASSKCYYPGAIIRGLIFSIFFPVLFAGTVLFAQETTILDNFNAVENNGKVFLRWVITSGSTCDGTKIFRSTDNLSYTQIGEIPGICGSSSEPKPYDFVDENPVKNQVNHYRLELGNNGFSRVVSLGITDLQDVGYQVRPNPVAYSAKIYFKNKNFENHQLKLFNQSGSIVYSSFTKDDFFEINAANYSPGLYIFILSGVDKTTEIKGKLVVEH